MARDTVTVPREPTDKMICAALDDADKRGRSQTVGDVYRAMISAAPRPDFVLPPNQLSTTRQAVAKAIYEVGRKLIEPELGMKLLDFERIKGRDLDLHLDYADAAIKVMQGHDKASTTPPPSSDPEGGARGDVQKSIATKQESCPESAPRTETAIAERIASAISNLHEQKFGEKLYRDDALDLAWAAINATKSDGVEPSARRLDDLGSVQDGLKMSRDGQPAGGLGAPDRERLRKDFVTAGETAPNSDQLTKTPSADHDASNLRATGGEA